MTEERKKLMTKKEKKEIKRPEKEQQKTKTGLFGLSLLKGRKRTKNQKWLVGIEPAQRNEKDKKLKMACWD